MLMTCATVQKWLDRPVRPATWYQGIFAFPNPPGSCWHCYSRHSSPGRGPGAETRPKLPINNSSGLLSDAVLTKVP